jgi:hypothetical protein
LDTRQRGRSGGPSSFPIRAVALLVGALLVVLLTGCDRDRSERTTPRATGREINEPFADLYVVAGKRGAGRLYALDLLNLELQPLAKRRDLRAVVRLCGVDRPVVRAADDRPGSLLILEEGSLMPAPEDVLSRDGCSISGAGGGSQGWHWLASSPTGKRVLVVKGRRVAIQRWGKRRLEHLGRTRHPLTSAIWVRR